MTPHRHLLARLLHWLAHVVYHHPRAVFYPTVAAFILSVVYTATHLEFITSRNDLVGADKKYNQIFLKFQDEFPSQDDHVVVVESADLEKNRQFVERLAKRLEAEPELFTNVFYKGDLTMMGRKALLFVPEESLEELRERLKDFGPFLQHFGQATNLNSLFATVNRQFAASARATNRTDTGAMMRALPAMERIVRQAIDAVQRPGVPPSPGVTALFDGGEQAQQGEYIAYNEGRIYLVTAQSAQEDLDSDAVARLRELVEATRAEVPGVNAGITGEPVLEVDEMAQAQRDTTVATMVALLIVALIFVYAYRETGRPLKATVTLIVGVGFTLGFATATIGRLNILSITFVPILIGLAIDFGVHLISRYEEELRSGRSEYDAMSTAMVFTGMGVLTSGLTTAGAFFAMAITDFKGVREMGFISGGGLVLCLIPMFTLLPVLLLRGRQNVLDHALAGQSTARERMEQFWMTRPGVTVATGLLLVALIAPQMRKVYFDYNLLHMQTEDLPAVDYQNKLIEQAGQSLLYGAVMADSLEEALRLEQKLTNLATVAKVESMARPLTEGQDRKLELVRQIKAEVAPLHFAPVDLEPVDVVELSSTTLYSLAGYCGYGAAEARKAGEEETAEQLLSLRAAVAELRVRMNEDRRRSAEKLGAFQQALFNDVHRTFAALRDQDDSARLRVEDLPPTLRNRFVGRTGKHLLQVYPRQDVWQREHQKEFVEEIRRTVTPEVTGTPVQLYEYTTLLKTSYEEAALYALGAIVVLVWIHFRSLICVLLALLPVAIGTVWMVGLMGLLNIPFNPANIMTLPLVVGIGVTSGIHILNRFAEEQSPSILGKSTGKAVLVSGLTTVAGFGSLMLGDHRGISSLGAVMAIGAGTCMLAALVFFTSLLALLRRKGWTIKKPSGSNALLPPGREEPR
jgi:uncharacterized protein